MFNKKWSLTAVLALCAGILFAQEEPLWMRNPAVSPDGTQVAFTYKGDIYKVSTQGGVAKVLTTHKAQDTRPIWSQDGKSIAFASNRYGNFDVFVMSAEGGTPTRLTYHSSADMPSDFHPDGSKILFTSSRTDDAESRLFPSGVLSELYTVEVADGTISLLSGVPAEYAKYNKTGTTLLYQDRKGYEDEFRKHHTSSVSRDIWSLTTANKEYKKLSSFNGEDRNPVWVSEDEFYYLSESDGSLNIYASSVSDPSKKIQLSYLSKHPIRNLTVSNDGKMVFSYDGSLYTLERGKNPEKIKVTIFSDDTENDVQIRSVSSLSEYQISADGKQMVFVHRGEVFVSSTDGKFTKRITNTPEQERGVSFSPDGKSILYASERKGSWNLYEAKLGRKEETLFFNATSIVETPLLETEAETFQASYSPDGKDVAFLEERTTLKAINLATKAVRTIVSGSLNYSYSDGDQYYEWSPDSKWLLVNFLQKEQWIPQVGLVSAEGGKEVINLSKSGYSNYTPKWMMNGEAIIWFSDRDGLKAQASWGAQADAYALFLTQKAFDTYKMTEEEFKLFEEAEKEKKEAEAKSEEESKSKDSKDKKSKDAASSDKKDEEVKPIKIDWEGLEDRKARLTIHSSSLTDATLSKDGSKLYYVTQFEKEFNLWETNVRTKETKIFAPLGADYAVGLIMDKKGENLFVYADNGVRKIELSSGKATPIAFHSEMKWYPQEERAYFFEHIWRQVVKKFYKPDLHGVDWKFYKEAYSKYLPHINNNYDFAEMCSELLGELNASHTGSGYRYFDPNGDQTASLGAFYDASYTGKGVRITEVMKNSPLVGKENAIKAGTIIEKVDGVELVKGVNFFQQLNRKRGQYVLLSLYDPASSKRWEEVVKPISMGEENELRYKRWVEMNRLEVEKRSNGKVGYVHVRGMDEESFKAVYEEALGRQAQAKALIVDTRFNGGGWLHDDLVTFLNGKAYVHLNPPGIELGADPMFKWKGISCVLMSESNYSDAHMFPYAYKALKIGKLIGMPVPGTGTAVWWETLQDPTLYFGIPQVGIRGNDGKYLENQQLEPDVRIALDPVLVQKGRDEQLEKAVDEMLKDLGN